MTPDSHTVYVGTSGDRSEQLRTGNTTAVLTVIDGSTFRVLRTQPIGSATGSSLRQIRSMAFDSLARAVYVASSQGDSQALIALTGRTYESAAGTMLFDDPGDVAVDSATHRIYVSGPNTGRVSLLDGTSPQSMVQDDFRRPFFIDTGPQPMGMAIDPSSQIVYVANSGNGTVSAIDESSNTVVSVTPIGGRPWDITVDPTTHAVYVTNQDSDTVTVLDGIPPSPLVPHDERYFEQTNFRVDDDHIWDFFTHRGGVTTFGYPTSRTFVFEGFKVQFFQRRIVQLDQAGQPRLLNMLDAGLLPYNSFSFSVFPSISTELARSTPPPTDAGATLAFVKNHAPDTLGNVPVNFYQTFSRTVPASVAFPNGGGNANLLAGFGLEMWGLPTSQPAVDPNNNNFIYLRWQRGIMMYDSACSCTQGVLLADYLKSVITGQDVPQDLAAEAKDSPLFRQYNSTKPHWVRDAHALPDTDLTNAFTPQ